MNTLSISSLVFSYQSGSGLQIPRLEVEGGSPLFLTGPSGCGKTTLLKLCCGLLQPAEGEVRFGDVRISGLEAADSADFRKKTSGVIFQALELVPHLTLRENVSLPLLLRGESPGTEPLEAIEQLGLADKLEKRPGELSQGEQQRGAICRALQARPALLLADEPTSSLDPAMSRSVMTILDEYCRGSGACGLITTHDVDAIPAAARTETFSTITEGAPA